MITMNCASEFLKALLVVGVLNYLPVAQTAGL